MAKINDYPAATSLGGGDVFLLDGTDGTRKMTAENVAAGVKEIGLLQDVFTNPASCISIPSVSTDDDRPMGWYRFAEYGRSPHKRNIFETGLSMFVSFKTDTGHHLNEVHSFILSSTDAGNVLMTPVINYSSNKRITKVRIYDNIISGEIFSYMDVYLSYMSDRSSITLLDNFSSEYTKWRLCNYTLVDDSPVYSSIYREFELPSNSVFAQSDTWPLTA